jgi:hypothetical protein
MSCAIGWLATALACTPLGLWMYEDPRVTVSRVRIDTDSLSARPVLVALDLQNPNDYVVSATRVELRLVLDDLPIGQLDEDSSVAVPTGIATVALPLTPRGSATRRRLRAFDAGIHRFHVEGRATFTTPIGKRKVQFEQTGELAFDQPPSPASAPSGPGASP